jgi:hypothetical protein
MIFLLNGRYDHKVRNRSISASGETELFALLKMHLKMITGRKQTVRWRTKRLFYSDRIRIHEDRGFKYSVKQDEYVDRYDAYNYRVMAVPYLKRLVAGFPPRRPGFATGQASVVCGGQSGTGAGFLRVLRFPLSIIIPPISLHNHPWRTY